MIVNYFTIVNYRIMKSHFVFTTAQRNGILGLILIIILLLGGMYWSMQPSPDVMKSVQQLEEEQHIQAFIDSLKKEKTKETTYTIYPFNPNFITDYKGYKLGMSPEEIDRLHQFREKDQWVNSTAEFQQVTGVSDSLLEAISVYFKFPDWVIARQEQRRKKIKTEGQGASAKEKSDLNKASREELQQIKGVGKVLSRRILRHRRQLHGFVGNNQLKDIYGLTYEVRQRIVDRFTVQPDSSLKKLDMNSASVAELSEIYYFDYELARDIVNYRITHEGIRTFEELAKVRRFPIGRLDRLKLYLKIDSSDN